jgi:hypothetical protein
MTLEYTFNPYPMTDMSNKTLPEICDTPLSWKVRVPLSGVNATWKRVAAKAELVIHVDRELLSRTRTADADCEKTAAAAASVENNLMVVVVVVEQKVVQEPLWWSDEASS